MMRSTFLAVVVTGAIAASGTAYTFNQVARDAHPIPQTQSIGSQLAQRKAPLTGVAARVDEIAKQITVLINATNGNGSGVIIARQGDTYYVLTAAHVVKNEQQYTVVTPDGEQQAIAPAAVTVLPGADLAVVQFSSRQNYSVATLADNSSGYEETNWIFLSGFPEARDGNPQRQLTAGIVFSEERGAVITKNLYSLTDINGYGLVYSNLSQGGMSGGAVLDHRGYLIGIHAAAEAETVIQESGEVAEFNLGWSLGVPIARFLAVVEQAMQPQWLAVDTSKPTQLSAAEIETIQESLAPTPPAEDATGSDWLDYGNQLWRAGLTEEAISAMNRAIEMQPNLYQAHYARAVALETQGDEQEVVAAYTKAVEINPRFYEAWRGRSLNQFHQGQFQEALPDIEEAIALQPQDWYLHNIKGAILFALGRYSDAIVAANRALDLNQEHSVVYLLRANAYRLQGEPEQALANYNRAIEINPENELIYMTRSLIHKNLGDYQKAIADINRAIEINPVAQYYVVRSTFYGELEQYEQAFADLEQATEIDPEFANAYEQRGLLHAQQQQYESAIADYIQAINLAPQSRDAYDRRGDAYVQLGEYESAIADFTQVLQLPNMHGDSFILKGNENFPESFQNLSFQEVSNFLSYMKRGQAYASLQQYESAIADFTSAININPNTVWGYAPRAAVYRQVGKNQEALADYARVSELNQNRPDLSSAERANPYKQRGIIYVEMQDYSRAVDALKQAIEINPEDAELYELLSFIYVQLQQ